MIEDNLLSISKVIFQNRNNWKFVTNDMKEKYFFIFNRYFSKKYPNESQLINHKSINKSIGLDLWFYFMKDKEYPKWFWSKSKFEKSSDLPEIDFRLLMIKLNLDKDDDLQYLINNFPEVIKEELEFYKTKQK